MADDKPVIPEPTEAERKLAEQTYADLKKQADNTGRDYILARMPVSQRRILQAEIDADYPPIEKEPPTVQLEQGVPSKQQTTPMSGTGAAVATDLKPNPDAPQPAPQPEYPKP